MSHLDTYVYREVSVIDFIDFLQELKGHDLDVHIETTMIDAICTIRTAYIDLDKINDVIEAITMGSTVEENIGAVSIDLKEVTTIHLAHSAVRRPNSIYRILYNNGHRIGYTFEPYPE